MWTPSSPTRNALAFVMAAAIAFLGSAMMLKAGRSFPGLTGGAPGADRPGVMVLAVVILFAGTGALLLLMAGKELLDLRRRPHER